MLSVLLSLNQHDNSFRHTKYPLVKRGFLLALEKSNGILGIWFWVSLLLHIASGIFIGLLYHYYYLAGDTLNYFQDALVLSKLARVNFNIYLGFLWNNSIHEELWKTLYYHQPRALFFSKVVSVINLLSHDNYWISSLYFSFVSFFAAYKFASVLMRLFPQNKASIIFSIVLFPSCVLWSSGIVKESVALAAVFYLCAIFLLLYKKLPVKWHEYILATIFIWLLYNIKYYYLAVLFPVLASALLYRKFIEPRLREKILQHKLPVGYFCSACSLRWSFLFIQTSTPTAFYG